MTIFEALMKGAASFIVTMLFFISIMGLAVFVQQSETPPSVVLYASVGAGFTGWFILGMRGIWLP